MVNRGFGVVVVVVLMTLLLRNDVCTFELGKVPDEANVESCVCAI